MRQESQVVKLNVALRLPPEIERLHRMIVETLSHLRAEVAETGLFRLGEHGTCRELLIEFRLSDGE